MREIKFRGKKLHGGEWVYGDLIHNVTPITDPDIFSEYLIKYYPYYDWDVCSIIPETVGQYTGLHDKNGKEIYEGDNGRYLTRDGSVIGEIVWEQQACAFWFKWFDGAAHRYKELKATESDGETYIANYLEVIGNIHEPEKPKQ